MGGLRIIVEFWGLMFLIFSFSEANREILVGGKPNAWTIPSSSNHTLNLWAERTRFKVGDVLVWKNESKSESVVQVTKEGYENCNKTNPIREEKSGETKIELEQSGPFYFISGAQGSCEKGLKLVVVVLSQHHRNNSKPNHALPLMPSFFIYFLLGLTTILLLLI